MSRVTFFGPDSRYPKSLSRLPSLIWNVYRPGYRWITPNRALVQRYGPYVLSSGVDEEIEAMDANSYEPSKAEPGLFRVFASLIPTQKNVLEFANRYGLLGGTAQCEGLWQITHPELPVSDAKVEPWQSWAFETQFMGAMVELWTEVQARDDAALGRRIKWNKDVATFQHGRGSNSVSLPPPPHAGSESYPLGPEPWIELLDDGFRTGKIHGWVVHPKRDHPKLVESLRSSRIETALYFLQTVLNRKLIEHSIQRPRLELVRPSQLGWQHVPSSLIGLMWLQFADAVANNRSFRRCAECKRWFEVTGSSVRSDKAYCSQACRIRVYRGRQAEARELYTLGATLEELTSRFDSDIETIQRWLGIEGNS